MAHCQNCGSKLREGATFCPNCGQKVASFTEASEEDPSVSYTEAEFELEDEEPSSSNNSESSSYEPYEPTRPEEEETSEYAGKNESKASQADPVETPPKKRISGLSITAFIFSLTVLLSGVGIILAIIDLVKSRKQPRKKGMSIAALIIGSIMLLAFIGNNIENIQNLMAPKEQTLAEIRGGFPYSGDGFTVWIGDHEWECLRKNNTILFYPSAEKGAEGGPSTSIEIGSFTLSPSDAKSPEELLERAIEFYGTPSKVKSLTVNGGYKGVWTEATKAKGTTFERTTRMAVWIAEDRVFNLTYYGVGLDSGGEAVYKDVLNSFQVTAQDASSAQADSSNQDPQDAPVLDGTLLYSPEDELDFAFILTDPDFTAEFNQDTVYVSRSSRRTDATIIISSIATAELSPEEQNPDVIIQDFMTSIGPLASGDYQITKIEVNGGFMASYSEGELDNSSVCVASWITGKRLYLVALVEPEIRDAEAEAVFHNLMRSFQPASAVTPPQSAQSETGTKKTVNKEPSLHYGNYFLVLLQTDGTVAVNADRTFYANDFKDLSSWTDIVAIDIDESGNYVLGLKNDGTVCISIPSRAKDEYFESAAAFEKELQSWSDIIAIEAGNYTVYGVTKNGKVVAACFNFEKQNRWLEGNNEKVLKWSNIIQIKEIGLDVYGRTKNGSWVTTYDYAWKDLEQYSTAVDLGGDVSVKIMLLSNGKLKLNQVDENNQYTGSLLELVDSNYKSYPFAKLSTILSSWVDIKEILMDHHHIIGLKNDGTLLSVFNPDSKYGNQFGQCNVAEWEDVIDITGDTCVTYGLKADGTVLSTRADNWYDSNKWR